MTTEGEREMQQGNRQAQMIFGAILTIAGISVAVGHYFAHEPHVPSKYEVMLAGGLILVGGWLIVPYGMQGIVDTVRETLPFLEDPHEHDEDGQISTVEESDG